MAASFDQHACAPLPQSSLPPGKSFVLLVWSKSASQVSPLYVTTSRAW
jgi:hypothetical protein